VLQKLVERFLSGGLFPMNEFAIGKSVLSPEKKTKHGGHFLNDLISQY
jgi:hypothetical protein